MAFCSNHERIYFDTLCRTKKAETLLSLIHATYQVKINNNSSSGKSDKELIAEKLEHAYELFKFDSGTYSGSLSAFESQYTIGHEMGIWQNSDLDLTPLATKVAEGNLKIKDYFSVVFLNYIQPVKGKILHVLHCLLTYMQKNNLSAITKEQMAKAYESFIPGCAPQESVNSVFNFLVATDYFKQTGKQELAFNSKYDIKDIIGLCDVTYLDETKYTYEQVKEKFKDLKVYLEYLLNEHQPTSVQSKSVIGENIILYGVPGSGKSHTIKRDYCNDNNYMERVVFHPDYSYSDFIGQILPEVDELGKISYKFKAGPFTRILKRAENDKANNYYLVVEEINRGNAPAIFGDIFQLLDRKNGESEYGITNADIAREAYEDPDRKVKIPSNLFILATMNTSDQNVFTLDTAFKRRWHMKMIENKLEDCKFADAFICGTPITWYSFAKTINKKIVEANKNNLSSEDNRLGAYFVDESDLYDVDLFSEKVLMYLWNDAFKFDRSDVFKAQYETLEELINGFKKQQFEIFSESVVFDTAQLPEATNSNVEAYLAGKDPEKIALYNQFIDKITNKMSGLNIMTTSTLVYIAIKKDNNNLAEVYIKKNAIKVVTLMPEREELQIGRKLPESYRWTKDYEIILTESNIDVVVDAILEANKLI